MDTIFSNLIPNETSRDDIARTLSSHVPPSVIQFLAASGAKVRALKQRERYDGVSPALRRLGIDVDSWPSPPGGLFVVEEKTVYVRSRSAMTIVHECGHAFDACLGNGVYLSSYDATLRRLFTNAKQFVTPYSSVGIDEYFAEAFRSMFEANDASSHWPKATRARLRRIDPGMHEYMTNILADVEAKYGEQERTENLLRC